MTFKTLLLSSLAAATLIACGGDKSADAENKAEMAKAEAEMKMQANAAKLDTILASADEAAKARFDARNPKETLLFMGVEPGMTVVEILPGGGWYTKILLPYLGSEGKVVGVDYSLDMWPEFGGFATEEFIEGRKTWATTWTASANEWRSEGDASVSAFSFGARDTSMDGQADAVLFIRALHNLARFEDEGQYLTQALADAKALLKAGGIVGVVQHEAPADADDVWAEGDNGYLKKAALIKTFEEAGFAYVGESDVNENPNDTPSAEDNVWRLPPTLGTSRDNPELKAEMEAIGESNRMTLKFKKL